MSTVLCSNCGISEKVDEKPLRCVKFGFSLDVQSTQISRECYYYTPFIKDGDEVLDPYETLAIKEAEMSSRRMKGPV